MLDSGILDSRRTLSEPGSHGGITVKCVQWCNVHTILETMLNQKIIIAKEWQSRAGRIKDREVLNEERLLLLIQGFSKRGKEQLSVNVEHLNAHRVAEDATMTRAMSQPRREEAS